VWVGVAGAQLFAGAVRADCELVVAGFVVGGVMVRPGSQLHRLSRVSLGWKGLVLPAFQRFRLLHCAAGAGPVQCGPIVA
jgi:hypothetical protein